MRDSGDPNGEWADITADAKPPVARHLVVLGSSRFVAGYWRAMRQPASITSVAITRSHLPAAVLNRFDQLMGGLFASDSMSANRPEHLVLRDHPVMKRLIDFAILLLQRTGMPVVGGVDAVRTGAGAWELGLPAIAASVLAPRVALEAAVTLMNSLASGQDMTPAQLEAQIQPQIALQSSFAPKGVNSLRLVETAHSLRIPWRHVTDSVYQYGMGRKGRLLNSTLTDVTPAVGVALARDKIACAQMLRAAGLPVPEHRSVSSEAQCLAAAEALGYPVVVKPVDLDGGTGVLAGLQTPAEVSIAYHEVVRLRRRVLVEKFIQGNDYRFRVFDRKILGVTARRPAGIVGDGKATVEELIGRLNKARAVQSVFIDPMQEQGAKPIVVDDEVLRWLANQGLSLKAIPPADRYIRLRGAANWSRGGTIWDIADSIHPDNAELAVAAAAVLRLDIAGVDLLLPDITRSWRETGGAICEVNAQPQLTAQDNFRFLLEKLCPEEGRIPSVVVTGSELMSTHIIARFGHYDGVMCSSRLEHCLAALLDPRMSAVVWVPETSLSSIDAVPFDRVDLWLCLGSAEPVDVPRQLVEARARWFGSDLDQAADQIQALL